MRVIHKICEQGLYNFVKWKNGLNKEWRSRWVENSSCSWLIHLDKFCTPKFWS